MPALPSRFLIAPAALAAIAAVAPAGPGAQTIPPALASSAAVEQTSAGARPALPIAASFEGIAGPRNPSDNSLAVGPDHVFQIVNSQLGIFSKKGKRYRTTGELLYGPIATNTMFAGFGEVCGSRANGDVVVRYDQLAGRWLVVMPIFRRAVVRTSDEGASAPVAKPGEAARPGQAADPGPPAVPGPPPPPPPPPSPGASGASTPTSAPSHGTYAMCYAISTGPDPLGTYHRYVFERPLFPDYPRPAVWPDGYYLPTSTGDDIIQKHTCIVDRTKMLFHETVLVEGEASQTNTLRWEDYTQTAVDPTDDCTIWYVGDYLKKDAASYSTRIGAFQIPGCS